ncbi:MAG: TonB family protein [Pseudomonadota bacterium]
MQWLRLGCFLLAIAPATAGAVQNDGDELSVAEILGSSDSDERAVLEALAQAERDLASTEASFGPDSGETAGAVSALGDALLARAVSSDAHLHRAVEAYKRCRSIYRRLGESKSIGNAQCEIGLARVHSLMSGAEETAGAYLRALEALAPLAQSDPTVAALSAEALLQLAGMTGAPLQPFVGLFSRAPEQRPLHFSHQGRLALDFATRAQHYLHASSDVDEILLAQAMHIEADALAALERYDAAAEKYAEAREAYSSDPDKFTTAAYVADQSHHWALGKAAAAESRATVDKNDCVLVEAVGSGPSACRVKMVKPVYPSKDGIPLPSGFAFVKYDIADDGGVENADIVSSWPEPAFGRAAQKAIRKWRYEAPLEQDGEPASIKGVVRFVNFNMTDDASEWRDWGQWSNEKKEPPPY